jgi:diguanylate cyclase (GGDEF)-like protein
MERHREHTLTHEVTSAFRLVIAGAAAMLATIAATTALFVGVSVPRVDSAAASMQTAQEIQRVLVQEQASLRAFVVTGDHSEVAAYRSANQQLQALLGGLLEAPNPGRIRDAADAVFAAEQRWTRVWARPAADPRTRAGLLHGNRLDATALATFVGTGKALFAAATDAQQQLVNAAAVEQGRARRNAVVVVGLTAVVILLIATAVVVSTIRRRRALEAQVVGPIRLLLEKVRAVGRGEFGAAPVLDAPAELLELRDELVDMSGSLRLQQQALAARAEESAQTARRLGHVVEFAREVSASLTLDHVLDAITSSSCRLLRSPHARVWLLSEDGATLRLARDSQVPASELESVDHPVAAAGVGRAATEKRLCYSLGLTGEPFAEDAGVLALAFPLMKGPQVVGVLEVALTHNARELRADTIEVLEAMGGHAATAIDAATLYATVESLSLSDPLTGVSNRRRFDQDSVVEVERSNRTSRALSVLMVDVDHFKAVNDTYGHQVGDTVLREIGALLSHHMRVGDTAYRFGGEEFAVLARDTDDQGAAVVAERIRAAVEERYAGGDGPAVTVSIGVAGLSDGARSVESLVEAADAALYAAKREGRNRVITGQVAIPAPRLALR